MRAKIKEKTLEKCGLEKIKKCKNCNLCINQPPLLDKGFSPEVMWVGLSAKKTMNISSESPLCKNTKTGQIIAEIESLFSFCFYKTNLVKCLPLDIKMKLRYPLESEMQSCYHNFLLEIALLDPKIVFLLGKKVSDFILNQQKNSENFLNISESSWACNKIVYIAIPHPSYIYVYKRKYIKEYVRNIQETITSLLETPQVIPKKIFDVFKYAK